MSVIAKMHVTSVEDFGGSSKRLKLNAVYDGAVNTGDNAENKSFTKATPWGECVMTVDNPYASQQFRLNSGAPDYKPASTHYVVFVDAEKHTLEEVMVALASLQ